MMMMMMMMAKVVVVVVVVVVAWQWWCWWWRKWWWYFRLYYIYVYTSRTLNDIFKYKMVKHLALFTVQVEPGLCERVWQTQTYIYKVETHPPATVWTCFRNVPPTVRVCDVAKLASLQIEAILVVCMYTSAEYRLSYWRYCLRITSLPTYVQPAYPSSYDPDEAGT